MKPPLAFLLACALSALDAGHPADAYELHGQKWPQDALGEPVYITYSYSNFLDGLLLDSNDEPVSVDELKSGVEGAMGVWATYAPLHFTEVPDTGPDGEPYDGGLEGQFRFGVHYIDGFGRTKAHARFPGNFPSSGDVHYDIADRWNLVGTLTFPDILGAAIHELGHSLGLLHSTDPNANMWPTFIRFSGPGTGTLSADDIAGIQAIYGAGTGSVTPLVVPEPSAMVLAAVGLIGLLTVRPSRTIG